jgi:putative SOS response-associated peptidase YedK
MCGRYAFFSPSDAVVRLFGLLRETELEPRYNIAPTQWVPAVREDGIGQRRLVMLRWGLLPSWARDPAMANRMINARAETVADKPAFRAAFRQRRCLLLADGWYEWQAVDAGKQPWFLRRRDGAPFGMAGLWERRQPPEGGDAIETCTIITTEATPGIRTIHERMPAVIAPAAYGAWLGAGARGPELQALLATNEDADWLARPVSRRVNDAHNDGPGLIEPVE